MRTQFIRTQTAMNRHIFTIGLLTALIAYVYSQYYGNYYCLPGRDVVVHLFDWKWKDIERECAWLAANNFCAVQVSVNVRAIKHLVALLANRERGEPVYPERYEEFCCVVIACQF